MWGYLKARLRDKIGERKKASNKKKEKKKIDVLNVFVGVISCVMFCIILVLIILFIKQSLSGNGSVSTYNNTYYGSDYMG